MVIAMDVYGWNQIPWNRNCSECVHFCAAPESQRTMQPLLSAIWVHMMTVHGIEMQGNPALAKELGKGNGAYRTGR